MQTKLDKDDLHRLHGQFSGCHFFISFVKACKDVSFLNSLGTIFLIFGPRNEVLSVLQTTIQIVKIVVNCNHYSLIEIIVSR